MGTDPTPYQTWTGTRPGDPVADLIFIMFFLLVQCDLQTALAAAGLVSEFPLDPAAPFGQGCAATSVQLKPPTFMDDLVILLQDKRPARLLDMLTLAASILCATMAKFGLQVNLKAGKTEAIVCLAGTGYKLARARMWASIESEEGAEGVPVLPLSGGGKLRIVRRYKHLGIMASDSRSFEPELAARLSAARSASAALAARLFASKHLDDRAKTVLASAVVESRALHGAGAWPALSAQQLQRTEAVLLRPFRRAMVAEFPREAPHPHVSNSSVRLRFRLVPLQIRLDVAKLRYALRIVLHGTLDLRALLQTVGGAAWRADLGLAMATMRQVLKPKLDYWPPPAGDGGLQVWLQFIKDFPGAWVRYVKLYTQTAADFPSRAAAALRTFRGEVDDSESDNEYLCTVCLATFRHRGGLLTHQGRAHGRRCSAGEVVCSSECPVCHFDHHSRSRCMRHLQRSPACAAVLAAGGLPTISPELKAVLEQRDREHRRLCRARGVSEFAGPPAVRRAAA